jgi:hypothetical protein
MLKNSLVAERLVASQEGLSSLELDGGEQFASRFFLERRTSGFRWVDETQSRFGRGEEERNPSSCRESNRDLPTSTQTVLLGSL